jgi:hypothetical protein
MTSYWVINGKKMSNEEYMEMIQREEAAREQAKQQAAGLMKRLADTYTELNDFMQQNPGIVQPVTTEDDQLEQVIYQKLRQNLTQADQAPRCQWVKDDGTPCGSPKMRKGDFCFAHMQMMEMRPKKLQLPAVEDANAIQMAIMEVQRALIDDEITEKKAGLLLYSLQIAAANLARTTFGQRPEEMVVATPLSQTRAQRGPRVESMGAKKALTTKDTKDTKKGLPLINSDDTDGNREIGSSGDRDIGISGGDRDIGISGGDRVMGAQREFPEAGKILPQTANGSAQPYASSGLGG